MRLFYRITVYWGNLFCATLSGLFRMWGTLSVGGASLTHGYFLTAFQAEMRVVGVMLSVGGASLTHGYFLTALQAVDPFQWYPI